MRYVRVLLLGLAALSALMLGELTPAESAFPGANGKIAFREQRAGDAEPEIYVMNADGSSP